MYHVIDLLLVIDTSSVLLTKQNLMQSALQTVQESLNGINPEPLVSIITYANCPKERCLRKHIDDIPQYFRCEEGGMSNCHAALNEASRLIKKINREKGIVVVIISACQATDFPSNLSSEGKRILNALPLVFLRADKSILPPLGVEIGNSMTLIFGSEDCPERLSEILKKESDSILTLSGSTQSNETIDTI